ncbi:hypothetical protein NQ315_011746 [Exocentrus adspersus]|uniref:MORN repeat-containing protein 5 n=1 Tax=Exocentrus adspersus TaxID=1586481 RepID=A0AAV8W1Y9_9CUCU|nr:hypothetical protein NQ315_011746 [Exocentrus adspersus]
MSLDSMKVEEEDEIDEEATMSILTTQTFEEEPLKLFGGGDRSSVSFVKRDTRYCKLVPVETKKYKRDYAEFCTGSAYVGEWNAFGFCGYGAYLFPHGVQYDGRFSKNGHFHGLGTLTYPSGQKMHGVWKHGKLYEYAFVFTTGEELDENFTYCQMPDRRFHVEIRNYFNPAGQEYLTAAQPTKPLPEECYDTVDGIYDPKYKFIMSHELHREGVKLVDQLPDIDSCKRIPTEEKIRWIKGNCRKAWDENTGYRPDLYDNWNAGRIRDLLHHESEIPTVKQVRTVEEPEINVKNPPPLVSFIKYIKKPPMGRMSMASFNRHGLHQNSNLGYAGEKGAHEIEKTEIQSTTFNA